MMDFKSFRPSPAISNAERQRHFRERNPGYYGRLHRQRKAVVDALCAAGAAQARMALAAPVQLMLPAPVEQLTLFDFALPQRELVPLTRPATETTAASAPSYES
jgi:hypothetical protein